MKPFEYSCSSEIHFGYSTRLRLGELLGRWQGKGLLIVDPAIRNNPLFTSLWNDCGSRFLEPWSGVEPNPSLQSVSHAVAQAIAGEAKFVVALGGGSAMDTAKAVALAAGTKIPIEDYHAGRAAVGQGALPLAALPTTAGTGSEVTTVAVLTDPLRGVKAPIGGAVLRPQLAIVDPEWTVALPPAVTAATGMDALSHALEAYWGVHAQPICDAYAEKATELILGALERAYACGEDREAREHMALGSLLAGMAFAVTKTAAVHACSYPLTQRFKLSHGVACALTLDAFLRYNAAAIGPKLNRLARIVGRDDAEALADRIAAMKQRMKLPTTLREAKIDRNDLQLLVSESFHPNMKNNPREVTPTDLMALYASLEG